MTQVLGLRPFVPARDYEATIPFYEALGFEATHRDGDVCLLAMGGFTFILQNFYLQAHADNTMVQLLVPDVDAWWAGRDVAGVAARFGAKAPIPPALQHWGLRVGFVFDPSGVLWHVAQPPG